MNRTRHMVEVYNNETNECVFSINVGEADMEATVNNLSVYYRPPTYDVVLDSYERIIHSKQEGDNSEGS